MAKKADLRAAKERKQKRIAAVGGVLLVIVLFVQVPRTLDMMSDGGEEPVAAAPATPAATPAATTPTAAPRSPAPVAEPETVVTASLVSFSRFESKDPFVQQVKDEEGASGETPAGASSGTDGPDGAISGPESGDGASPAEPAAKTQAEIEVNGALEAVSVDTPFPAANPMFLLVSVAPKSASIKVADGGSFASGAPTLKLALGKPVTLVNTADGTRFVLLLKRVP